MPPKGGDKQKKAVDKAKVAAKQKVRGADESRLREADLRRLLYRAAAAGPALTPPLPLPSTLHPPNKTNKLRPPRTRPSA